MARTRIPTAFALCIFRHGICADNVYGYVLNNKCTAPKIKKNVCAGLLNFVEKVFL